jgi:hypothetical protein
MATRLAARLSPTKAGARTAPGAGDVRQSYTVALDSSAGPVVEALHRLDLSARAARALHALDLADRFALFLTQLGAPSLNSVSFGLIWRIDGSRRAGRITPDGFEGFGSPGHIKVRWSVDLTPSESRVFLSIATRFTATDAGSRARLLDAWAVIGPLSDAFVHGAVRSVKDYVEDQEDEPVTPSGTRRGAATSAKPRPPTPTKEAA